MIQIEIPEFELTVNQWEWRKIPNNKGGIYYLFDASNTLLYIGLSENLRSRIRDHFSGMGNTSRFSKQFITCSMFFEDDPLNRELYETYLINKLRPPLNISKKLGRLTNYSKDVFLKRTNENKCKFIKNSGKQCGNYAHTNGFCHVHGGNGISRQRIIENALKCFSQPGDLLEYIPIKENSEG